MATDTFKQQVDSIIKSRHLLQHPFYIAWTEGKLTREQVTQIATDKLPDMNANDVAAASKVVAGTARSMGIEVEV